MTYWKTVKVRDINLFKFSKLNMLDRSWESGWPFFRPDCDIDRQGKFLDELNPDFRVAIHVLQTVEEITWHTHISQLIHEGLAKKRAKSLFVVNKTGEDSFFLFFDVLLNNCAKRQNVVAALSSAAKT